MKFTKLIVITAVSALLVNPAFAKKDKEKNLPPGLQKNQQRGKPLPPGWQKKLVVGEKLDKEIFEQSQIVVPVDRKGLLRDISAVLANEDVDVVGVKTHSDRKKDRATMRFTIEIQNIQQLSRDMEKVSQLPDLSCSNEGNCR